MGDYMHEIIRKRQQAVVAAALVIGIGGLGFASANHFASSSAGLDLKLAGAGTAPSRTGFASVVKKALPSVVNISSSKVSKASADFSDQLPDDDLFRQFFGRDDGRFGTPHQMPQQRERALGSGVIMTSNGYILTNNHVVDGATEVRVMLGDDREFKAKVIGKDPKTDVAVLKIDATNLAEITVADSAKVEVGDYAIAIGNPFGVGQTVTMGIVSAKGRSHLGIEDYEDFIQTDAPINPGNSGGALVNDQGQLIGINTAIIAHGSEGNQGIGFAIPANLARNVMEQIVKNGKVTRAYLGIVPQDVTPSVAKSFGLSEPRGALVGDVSADSPAQKSDLVRGDIILEVNGRPVANSNDLRMTISMMAPDSSVNLKVFREGRERNVTVKLSELPTTEAVVEHQGAGSSTALSGVSVQNLTPQSSKELGLPAGSQGVVVTDVRDSSPAAEAGLRRGDVIQEVNRKPVKNTSDFEHSLADSKEGTLLLVNRNGSTMYLAV
jgi:serine protease Do